MKTRKIVVFIVCTLLAMNINFVSAEQIVKVRVTNWPPKYFPNKDGNWIGIDAELTYAIIEEAGFRAEFDDLPWARGVDYLKEGIIDIIPGFAVNEERKEFAEWIGPHRNVTINLIVKKGDAMRINSLNDMIEVSSERGHNFGHQNKAFFSKEYNSKLESDPIFKGCFEIIPNQELNLKKLKLGRILGFFEETGSISYKIKNNPEYSYIEIHPFILDSRPTYLGVSKKTDRKIFDRLENAYQKLEQNGTLKKIRDKWGY